MSNILVGLVIIYQNTIGILIPPSCRYSPTCSQYMIDAIKLYGSFKGFVMGISRIGRCHPWSNHNYKDPVK